MAPLEFGVFLPFYANHVTEAYEKMYSPDRNSWSATLDNNMYWVFRQLHTECALSNLTERNRIGQGVIDFWDIYQKALLADQVLIDKYMKDILVNEGIAKAEEAATKLSMDLCKQTYEHAKNLLAEVRAHKALGSSAGAFVPSYYAEPVYRAPVTVLKINASPAVSVKRGETVSFDLILNDGVDSKNIVWSSSNALLAAVNSSGTVSIQNRTGTAVLFATDPDSSMQHSIILRIS
jgi:hypothetical protein